MRRQVVRAALWVAAGHAAPPAPPAPGRLAAFVLNSPVTSEIVPCWNAADVRLCCDGGAAWVAARVDRLGLLPPTAVVGDLDSVPASLVARMSASGVRVLRTPDQDSNDFRKAVGVLNSMLPGDVSCNIVVYNGLGGRLDQELANLSVAVEAAPRHAVSFVTPFDIVVCVPPGEHTVVVPPSVRGHTCGVLPIVGPATVTSKGLRWELDRTELRMGSLVSSSNRLLPDTTELALSTSAHVLLAVLLRSSE